MKKTAVCVIMALALVLGGCSAKSKEPATIELNDYLDYSIEGYSSKASLTFSIRYDDIIEDFELEDVSEKKLQKKITGSWNNTVNISNGDELTFSWDTDLDSIEEEYNVEFDDHDLVITVTDLEEMPVYNPFDYITVSFSGMSGDGTATIDEADNNPISDVYYTFDSSQYYLSNGDTVTIRAYCSSSYASLEALCRQNDYALECETFEYTVEGLDEYVSSIDQVTPEMLAELQGQAEDTITANLNLGDDETLNSLTYCGMYLMSHKDATSYIWTYNKVYLVYAVNVTNTAETLTYYTYVAFENLILKADGTNEIYNILDTDVPYGSSWGGDIVTSGDVDSWGYADFYYVGFDSVTSLYNTELRPELESYDITTDIPDSYFDGEAPAEESAEEPAEEPAAEETEDAGESEETEAA